METKLVRWLVRWLFLELTQYNQYVQTGYPDSKVHGANMRFIWGRRDQGGPHVGPMNLAIRVDICVDSGYIIKRATS